MDKLTDDLLHAAVDEIVVLSQGPGQSCVGESGIVLLLLLFVFMRRVGDVDDARHGRTQCRRRAILQSLQLARAAQRRAQKLLLARHPLLFLAPLPLVILHHKHKQINTLNNILITN